MGGDGNGRDRVGRMEVESRSEATGIGGHLGAIKNYCRGNSLESMRVILEWTPSNKKY